MLLTIEHCWVIVPDKRATFLKNTRRYTQILDPSEEGKLIEESASQLLKKLSKFRQFVSSVIEYLMVFPEARSTENYAMKNPAIASDLSQLSLCFFVKLIQDQGAQIVVSYAKKRSNEMLVEIYPTRTDVYVGNKLFR